MTTDGGGPDPGRAAPDLVLRPLLRYVADTEATILVETGRADELAGGWIVRLARVLTARLR